MRQLRPRAVGRYLLFDAFASGGMATVHFGRLIGDEGFKRSVALKRLHAHFATNDQFVGMFLDEARLLARIHHPSVVAPLDVLRFDGELFIAMQYVHGEALSGLLGRAPYPVAPAIACAILTHVLLGLDAAHEATNEDGHPLQIVHRDVSPQNILVGVDGLARIVDFGIAKASARSQVTSDGQLKGKLGYFAPEQLSQSGIDRRTDIFTVGIVLWETLTGRRLYATDVPSAARAVLATPVEPPSSTAPGVSAELDAVVLRALSHRAEDRFLSAREMAEALGRVQVAASLLEVGDWVEQIAGEELARRAQIVADIDALSLDDLTLGLPLTRPTQMGPFPGSEAPVSRGVLDGAASRVARGGIGTAKLTLLVAAVASIATVVLVVLSIRSPSGFTAPEPAMGSSATPAAPQRIAAANAVPRHHTDPSLWDSGAQAADGGPAEPVGLSPMATTAKPTDTPSAPRTGATGSSKPVGTVGAATRPTVTMKSGPADCRVDPFTVDEDGYRVLKKHCAGYLQ